jgi:hypothetical protein
MNQNTRRKEEAYMSPQSHSKVRRAALALCVLAIAILFPLAASAQQDPPGGVFAPGANRSSNMKVLSHIPLGSMTSVADIEIEQELSRPYAYVSRRNADSGFDIIDMKDPTKAKVILQWRIEDLSLHQGSGGLKGMIFKRNGRNYYIQSFQFGQGGPDSDLGAIVFDVTALPNVKAIKEVGRIRAQGGFHNIFSYISGVKKPLLFATQGDGANIYDLDKFLAGDKEHGLVGKVPVPESPGMWSKGYHDFYVGFDPATQTDKFYGGGGAGYYVYDVTAPAEPKLLFTLTGINGVVWGHTFTPTPDGRYAIGETEWQYQPLLVFDMKDAQEGKVKNINRSIGAWQADWKTLAHMHEVRWPYVFVAGYETGLSVVNMMDPTNPKTVGFYDHYDGPHNKRPVRPGNNNYTWGVYIGGWGCDVRNADGLIACSDGATGFWSFKMEGFDGWNGNDWGVPNNSSAQDWDKGPDGARPKSLTLVQ